MINRIISLILELFASKFLRCMAFLLIGYNMTYSKEYHYLYPNIVVKNKTGRNKVFPLDTIFGLNNVSITNLTRQKATDKAKANFVPGESNIDRDVAASLRKILVDPTTDVKTRQAAASVLTANGRNNSALLQSMITYEYSKLRSKNNIEYVSSITLPGIEVMENTNDSLVMNLRSRMHYNGWQTKYEYENPDVQVINTDIQFIEITNNLINSIPNVWIIPVTNFNSNIDYKLITPTPLPDNIETNINIYDFMERDPELCSKLFSSPSGGIKLDHQVNGNNTVIYKIASTLVPGYYLIQIELDFFPIYVLPKKINNEIFRLPSEWNIRTAYMEPSFLKFVKEYFYLQGGFPAPSSGIDVTFDIEGEVIQVELIDIKGNKLLIDTISLKEKIDEFVKKFKQYRMVGPFTEAGDNSIFIRKFGYSIFLKIK